MRESTLATKQNLDMTILRRWLHNRLRQVLPEEVVRGMIPNMVLL